MAASFHSLGLEKLTSFQELTLCLLGGLVPTPTYYPPSLHLLISTPAPQHQWPCYVYTYTRLMNASRSQQTEGSREEKPMHCFILSWPLGTR